MKKELRKGYKKPPVAAPRKPSTPPAKSVAPAPIPVAAKPEPVEEAVPGSYNPPKANSAAVVAELARITKKQGAH